MQFWKSHSGKYPIIAQIARCYLGFGVSAAAIERDFGTAGLLITPRRNRLHASVAEVILFLNINRQLIPTLDSIPILSELEARHRIPFRFTGDLYAQTSILSNEEEESDISVDYVDDF